MNAYVYQAALHCADCAAKLIAELAPPPNMQPRNESTWDSDDYPKGPYADGGGEADCPQHCDTCGAFLENPLTAEGENYVRELLARGDRAPTTRSIWHTAYREFYDWIRA